MAAARLALSLLSPAFLAYAGPYPGSPGTPGSTAISKDDPRFVGWATGVAEVRYGEAVDAGWKTPDKALGPAEGTAFDVVVLGRGGTITLTFEHGIGDGDGPDFAVFENALDDRFLELAWVEVSSNGVDFFRFENHSLTPAPVSAYGRLDPTDVDGFAGKYRQGWGTPFDLRELAGVAPELDISRVTHVRLVDVVGDGTARDSDGRIVYDPYPTVGSAGFDLDAVGVLHRGIESVNLSFRHHGFEYPGPEFGAGSHAPGSTVSWRVVSPWPSAAGEAGERWLAAPAAGTMVLDADRVVDVYWRRQVWVEVKGWEDFASVGTGWYDAGSEVPWSVQSPVPVGDGLRQRAEPAAGVVRADRPLVVETAWRTEAWLEIRRSLPGVVSPESGWYAGTVVVRAENRCAGETPVYFFQRWEGDIDAGREASDTELELNMDRPRKIKAVFAFNDSLPAVTIRVPLQPGWNLVSLPVYVREPVTVSRGPMSGPFWVWDETSGGQYRPADFAVPGEGFWILVAEAGAVLTAEGYHPGEFVPSFASGWQLFGVSAGEGPVDSGSATVWEWDASRQSYRRARSITEGRGYWRYPSP